MFCWSALELNTVCVVVVCGCFCCMLDHRITAHGIHVLSADALIQEALEAHRTGEPASEVCTDHTSHPSPLKAVCSRQGYRAS